MVSEKRLFFNPSGIIDLKCFPVLCILGRRDCMLLYPAKMQGITLVVMQHLYFMFRETEEVAEVEQEDPSKVFRLRTENPLMTM